METKSNLDFWNKVEKTNPKYTKKAKISGHEITAIAPQYQIMQVTEQFGIYGEKWGFKNIALSYDLVEKFNMVVFKGTFFFPNGEFEIINSCKLYMDRNLTMVDDNFAKKIETDALTKAISKLGFNADIFMGKFDDVRYVEEMNKEFENEQVPVKNEPKQYANAEPKKNEPTEWLNLFDKQGNEMIAYTNLAKAIADGKHYTLKTIRDGYKVSKQTEKELLEHFNIS